MRTALDATAGYQRVKVRGTPTFLWGGVEIVKHNLGDDSPLYLTVKVPETANEVRVGIRSEDNTLEDFGKLQPGEMLTFHLKDLLGVYATADQGTDTHVECGLLAAD